MASKKTTPNRYVLGTAPRIKVTPIDTGGVFFVPTESRLSIKEPTGNIVTYSGADMTLVPSGYLYVIYHPQSVGWYQYESWVKDGNNLEDAATLGFEVYDLVRAD